MSKWEKINKRVDDVLECLTKDGWIEWKKKQSYMNTITRKIQIYPIGEEKNDSWRQLREWNEMVFRAANTAASHMYFQNNMKEFFYLTDDAKILFADINKEPKEGEKAVRVLNTSKQNSTYQVLSSHFKGKMPSDIFVNLNSQLYSTFSKEVDEYFSGKRSLRTYKRSIPMPISAKSIKEVVITSDAKNYQFEIFGIKFQTSFGRDSSGNKMIFDRALNGEYKLCNSSIQIDGKKMFLLAVFQFESEKFNLDKNKVMEAELSDKWPIVLSFGEKKIFVGDRKEYLHRRLAIQAARRRQQIASRYNVNGKGRKKKMASVDRFHDKELNYIQTRQHQYTFKMISLCLEKKCGVLRLKFTPEPPEPDDLSKKELRIWREENQFLLRNWGYYGLKEKLKYKCKKAGIELLIEKGDKEKKED